jgi:5-methylcytosine-specific restriction protein A
MKNIFFEEHQLIANFLAKFPNAYELLGVGNQTQTHKYIAEKFDVGIGSFRMLRDEYDGFYDNGRKGFDNPYKRKSRVEFKEKYDSLEVKEYLDRVLKALETSNQKNIETKNDEKLDESIFREGSKITIEINKYERNIKAKQKCLKHFGRVCAVCNFKDNEIFGTEISIIEVHHKTPISNYSEEYEINAIEDLIPLCPNCHRAVHSKIPAYSIDELRKIIKTVGNSRFSQLRIL